MNYFWSVKHSLDVLDKLKYLQVPFYTILYTTLPHKLIKEKLSYLINCSIKILVVHTYATKAINLLINTIVHTDNIFV